MLPDEVRKAVEDIEFRLRGVWEPQADVHADFAAIKAHLLAREADVERLNAAWDSSFKQAMLNGQSAQEQRARAERAEALLRRHQSADVDADTTLYGDTEAHLSENSRG